MKRLVLASALLVASACSAEQEPLVVVESADSPVSIPTTADEFSAPHEEVTLRGMGPVAADDFWFCDGYYCKDNPEALPEILRLLAGNAAFLAGDTRSAIAKWREIIDRHLDTPEWNMAILNSGRVLRAFRRHVEAIAVLKLLLEDSRNSRKHYDRKDHESTPMDESTRMDRYASRFENNDWYDACAAVSQSYEALGEFAAAKRYAILSRDQFWYTPICSMDGATHGGELDDRIAALELRIEKMSGEH